MAAASSASEGIAASATDRNLVDDIKNSVSGLKDSLKDNLQIDARGIKSAGSNCHAAARETSEICAQTTSKASKLVGLGLEMKAAVDGLSDGKIGAQDVAAVATLVGSDKVGMALSLATEMDDLALSCARKSVNMIDAIDAGIETLPDLFEKNLNKRMENAREKGAKEGDPDVPNLEADMRSLEAAVKDVQNANPISAVESFQRAFDGISTQSRRCEELFCVIKSFADDVSGVSSSIENFDLGKMVGHARELVRDTWRCLRLSDLIRTFAEAVEKLINVIVKLIQALLEKIQSLDVSSMMAGCGCCTQLEGTLESFGLKTSDLQKFAMQALNAFSSWSAQNSGSNTGGRNQKQQQQVRQI